MAESQGTGGSTTSAPPMSPADAAQSAALAAQAAQRAEILKQVGILVCKTAGKAALEIVGSAALLSLGTPGLAIAVGKSILNSNEVGALVNSFSRANTGVNLSTLLAVIQGQPGVDYQAIIDALKLLQQQQANSLQLQGQTQAPPVDSQAVITKLTRRLLAAAQQAVAQQQAPPQQHISQTSNRTRTLGGSGKLAKL